MRRGLKLVYAIILLLFALLCVSPASGQLIITGGDSSLFGAAGGGASYYRGDTQSDVGLGLYRGRWVIGADHRFEFHRCQIVAGDYLESLSTIGAGLGVANRGMALDCGNKKQRLRFFAGESGQFFSAPFFNATGNTGHFGTGVLYQRFVHNLELDYVVALAGNQHVYLQGARYHLKKWSLDEAAGKTTLGGYFQGDASYSAKHFAASVSHADFVGKTEYSSEGLSVGAGPLTLFGSAFESPLHTGEAVGGTLSGPWVSVSADMLFANQKQLVGFLTEHKRHLMLTQAISHSAGGNSVSFGGGYQGNTLSGSVGYSEVFNPLGGFERAMVIDAGIQLPRFTLHLSLEVLPSGITYTGFGTAYVRGPALSTGQATQMAE
jgi:hypothetical protein